MHNHFLLFLAKKCRCDVTFFIACILLRHTDSSLAIEFVFVVVWDSDVVRLQEFVTFVAAIVNIFNFTYVYLFDILNELILFKNTLDQLLYL